MKGDFWKEKLFICKYEIIFGYPFESCTRGPNCERRGVVLGPLFLNFGSFLAQVLPDPNEGYLEKVEYGFKNIK
jgi:hypothetical protein